MSIQTQQLILLVVVAAIIIGCFAIGVFVKKKSKQAIYKAMYKHAEKKEQENPPQQENLADRYNEQQKPE